MHGRSPVVSDPPGARCDQVERLRAVIDKKNELYFHRWRPQNETYLFGFRKHEQGNNAVEIPQFDPLVAEKEEEIARLKKPVKHTYELIRGEEGKSATLASGLSGEARPYRLAFAGACCPGARYAGVIDRACRSSPGEGKGGGHGHPTRLPLRPDVGAQPRGRRRQLAEAMTARRRESHLRPIAEILSDRGWIDRDSRDSVDRLVDAELDRLRGLDSADDSPPGEGDGQPRNGGLRATTSATDREMSTIDQGASLTTIAEGDGTTPEFGRGTRIPSSTITGG